MEDDRSGFGTGASAWWPGRSLVVLAAGRARRFGGCKPLAPVGPGGVTVLDLLASDALAGGFGSLVLVVNPATGPALRDHVRRRWPSSVRVSFAEQPVPQGTVAAVLAARHVLEPDAPFGVANADDCYGAAALGLLASHLEGPTHVTVAFRLGRTLLGDGRVNRGICEVDPEGFLSGLAERRDVGVDPDGTVSSRDGRAPRQLDPAAPAAMNLWGFQPGIWAEFEAALAARSGDEEVLIPEVVGRAARRGDGQRVRVVRSEGACVGVTHPGDLPLVRSALAAQTKAWERPSVLWSAPAGAAGVR